MALTWSAAPAQHGVLAFGGLGKRYSGALHRFHTHALAWEPLATSGVLSQPYEYNRVPSLLQFSSNFLHGLLCACVCLGHVCWF